MNRQEFILALREELAKLPPEEIVNATQYFEECFDEATDGLDEEARIAEENRLAAEFGSPKRIAAQIKADYAAKILGDNSAPAAERPGAKKKLSAVWWIILGICSAPIAIPIVVCMLMMVFCIVLAIIACFVAGIAIIGFGFGAFAQSIAEGFMTIGIGLMLAAAAAAAIFGAFLGIREIIRAVARGVRKNSETKKAAEVEMEISTEKDEKTENNVSSGTDGAAENEADAGPAADEIELEVE